MTELVEIMANLAAAIQTGELTQEQAVDLLDAFQDHEFESYRERVFPVAMPAPQPARTEPQP
jgi:hypothetical protein